MTADFPIDRIVVPVLVALGIGAGTVLPIIRARAKTGATGLTFQQRRRPYDRLIGGVVGLLGGAHLAWGPLYAFLGPQKLAVHPSPPWAFWTGVAIYLASLALVVSAQRTMGKAWRIGIDQGTTALVSAGIYAYVRNPIYVGAIGCGLGMSLVTPCWFAVSGALGYLVFIQFQVRVEERHLASIHGASYLRYLDSVGRFIPRPSRKLSRADRRKLTRFAEAVAPEGRALPAAGETTVAGLEVALDAAPSASVYILKLTLTGLELAGLVTRGARFSRLPLPERSTTLSHWLNVAPGVTRHALRALVAQVKLAYFDEPNVARAVGTRTYPNIAPERERWHDQLRDGIDLTKDETLEADVVVVGTGAGGAVVAYELAARGHAVVLIEEGRWFGRHEFVGPVSQARAKMFRDGGQTLALGNVLLPLWTGVTVGGSTTVNSGTCYRTPERILQRWQTTLGLEALTSAEMKPHFERVEEILGIAPTRETLLGGTARATSVGLAKLSWQGHPIARNAPECDGQGRCMFGCPTGAKRSTNVSYVPMALEKGALLLARTKAERVVVEGGAARGLEARSVGGASITVKAKVTILAGGALMTPCLLLANRLANRSGMVGRNLSVHPAAPVLGLFPAEVDMQRNVPQSFAVEQFASEGLMLEESGNPPEVAGIALPLVGPRFLEIVERYGKLGMFGYMIEDTSRGTVRPGTQGRPAIAYSVNETDTRRLQRGAEALVELFLASGATSVFPAVRGFEEIRDLDGLAALRAHSLRPGDFALSAVHPLGTARMGRDPQTSVVKPDHETHDVPGLFVVDGSSVPTALGVNPQVTIMAMATRAAGLIHERL